MPESTRESTNWETSTEAAAPVGSAPARSSFFSTEYAGSSSPLENVSDLLSASARDSASEERPDPPWLRINWEIKALAPIAVVLLGGMLLFLLAHREAGRTHRRSGGRNSRARNGTST